MSKNPYVVAKRVLRIVGQVLYWTLIGGILLMFLVGGITILWPTWGAWALTLPLIAVVAYLGVILAGIGIANLFWVIREKWTLAALKWDYENRNKK